MSCPSVHLYTCNFVFARRARHFSFLVFSVVVLGLYSGTIRLRALIMLIVHNLSCRNSVVPSLVTQTPYYIYPCDVRRIVWPYARGCLTPPVYHLLAITVSYVFSSYRSLFPAWLIRSCLFAVRGAYNCCRIRVTFSLYFSRVSWYSSFVFTRSSLVSYI